MIINVQRPQRRDWRPASTIDVPASYRIEPNRGGADSALVRRWHTDRVWLVPRNAHPRYVTTRHGQLRLIGFDELLCQHSGDFADCIANDELGD